MNVLLLVASLFLVVWPGAPSSALLLVAMPFAPSSVLHPPMVFGSEVRFWAEEEFCNITHELEYAHTYNVRAVDMVCHR